MNAKQLRKAEFITPPNSLRKKMGYGGLDEHILESAQKLIDDSGVDFLPMGQRYLVALQEGIRITETQKEMIDNEALIATMLYPAMQLKANGGMFGYPLITAVSTRLVSFLEQIREPDPDAIDIILGFSTSLQAVLMLGENASDVTAHGHELYEALDDACARYFEKYLADTNEG